jgi:hypothetical protein
MISVAPSRYGNLQRNKYTTVVSDEAAASFFRADAEYDSYMKLRVLSSKKQGGSRCSILNLDHLENRNLNTTSYNLIFNCQLFVSIVRPNTTGLPNLNQFKLKERTKHTA